MKKVFISYAHNDDQQWITRVKNHISVLRHEGLQVTVWDDTMIKPGTRWKEEISKELGQAIIAVLLVSTDFLASNFIRDNELPPLLKAAEANGTLILPIIVSPCRFTSTEELKDFQAVNDPKITLSEVNHSQQERVLLKMTDAIEEHLKNLKN